MTENDANSSPDHPLSPEKPRKTFGLQDFSLGKTENSPKLDLDTMSQADLLRLLQKVELRMTGLRLSEMNLEKETLKQFHKAKLLQEEASKPDSDIPMNQRAQVQNSLGNLLKDLGKMQMALYNSETLKRLQATVIKVAKKLPKEAQDEFFEMLEIELEEAEKQMQNELVEEQE